MTASQDGQKNRYGKTIAIIFRNVFYYRRFIAGPTLNN